MEEYRIQFYINSKTGECPTEKFLRGLPPHVQAKINKYLEFLRLHEGHIDEPYSRHIVGKIRELRVDFSNIRHRIFYFTFVGKKIILLHGFVKKTAKTPIAEINKAIFYYTDVISNAHLYD